MTFLKLSLFLRLSSHMQEVYTVKNHYITNILSTNDVTEFDFFVQIIKYVIVPSIISEQYL